MKLLDRNENRRTAYSIQKELTAVLYQIVSPYRVLAFVELRNILQV